MASMQNSAAKRGNHRLPRNPGMSSYSNSVLHLRFISASVSLLSSSEFEQQEGHFFSWLWMCLD